MKLFIFRNNFILIMVCYSNVRSKIHVLEFLLLLIFFFIFFYYRLINFKKEYIKIFIYIIIL